MQTQFTPAQLIDPHIEVADGILRACVHCGFCLATCPTYQLLGDERDSPRGRIYLIKEMLEGGGPATAAVATHVDRCLSCLSCMTTCPSGVNYMHLVDHARVHIANTFTRPWTERLWRALLALVLPRPRLFRAALLGARLARPLASVMPAPVKAMLELLPASRPAPSTLDAPQTVRAEGARRKRVALLTGCVQGALAPEINAATSRILARHGCDVVIARGAGCCGALTHHLGMEAAALASARANVAAWSAEIAGQGLDAIIVNASGCGTVVKDYGFLLRLDPEFSGRARAVSALARDVSEFLGELGLPAATRAPRLKIAYHSACSLQHGQKIAAMPKKLLQGAGFNVADVPEGHLCCGSAGTYNLLQPELATQLRTRKVANIATLAPDAIATGNIGCMTQLAAATATPVLHTVELLDWATGGPVPAALGAFAGARP